MSIELYEKFDSYLSKSDYDSMSWNDGMGYEEAEDMICEFSDEDWTALLNDLPRKDRLWRGCLVTLLWPGLGAISQNLLVKFLDDENTDVSFMALGIIAFYCGVNRGPDGAFEEDRILNVQFKEFIRSIEGITTKIESLSRSYAPQFREEMMLLVATLNASRS